MNGRVGCLERYLIESVSFLWFASSQISFLGGGGANNVAIVLRKNFLNCNKLLHNEFKNLQNHWTLELLRAGQHFLLFQSDIQLYLNSEPPTSPKASVLYNFNPLPLIYPRNLNNKMYATHSPMLLPITTFHFNFH